eukprot:1389395-Amorphochlora_amoeboformis.AAC.1
MAAMTIGALGLIVPPRPNPPSQFTAQMELLGFYGGEQTLYYDRLFRARKEKCCKCERMSVKVKGRMTAIEKRESEGRKWERRWKTCTNKR